MTECDGALFSCPLKSMFVTLPQRLLSQLVNDEKVFFPNMHFLLLSFFPFKFAPLKWPLGLDFFPSCFHLFDVP